MTEVKKINLSDEVYKVITTTLPNLIPTLMLMRAKDRGTILLTTLLPVLLTVIFKLIECYRESLRQRLPYRLTVGTHEPFNTVLQHFFPEVVSTIKVDNLIKLPDCIIGPKKTAGKQAQIRISQFDQFVASFGPGPGNPVNNQLRQQYLDLLQDDSVAFAKIAGLTEGYYQLRAISSSTNASNSSNKAASPVQCDEIEIAVQSRNQLESLLFLFYNWSECFNLKLQPATYWDKYRLIIMDHRHIDPVKLPSQSFQDLFLADHYDLGNNPTTIPSLIQDWHHSRSDYKRFRQSYHLGFLFSGPPGCGKTSLAYAIANSLFWTVTRVDITKMSENILRDRFSELTAPTVVLFDEVDRMLDSYLNSDVVQVLETKSTNKEPANESLNLDKANAASRLTKLLEIMDLYLEDCIIVFTTNHPEKLDPALIRPGRIDHHFRLGLCSHSQFQNIFKYYTGVDLASLGQYRLPADKYSVAHVIRSVMIPYRKEPQRILQELGCELVGKD